MAKPPVPKPLMFAIGMMLGWVLNAVLIGIPVLILGQVAEKLSWPPSSSNVAVAGAGALAAMIASMLGSKAGRTPQVSRTMILGLPVLPALNVLYLLPSVTGRLDLAIVALSTVATPSILVFAFSRSRRFAIAERHAQAAEGVPSTI